jgi:hypothetical protein
LKQEPGLTIAVVALGHLAVVGQSSVTETFDVFFGGLRPAVTKATTRSLGAIVKAHLELTVQNTLKVD